MDYTKNPSPALVRQWLDACIADGINLTQWEQDFLTDNAHSAERWGSNWRPTRRQAELIERIYTERVP